MRWMMRIGMGLAVVCCGCIEQRVKHSNEDLKRLGEAHEVSVQQTRQSLLASLVNRARLEHDEYREHGGPEPTMDILVLSGGGQYGAFGSGFLKGWGDVEDQSLRRPQFDYVTGVSTGSLIAPFAFLGEEEEYNRIERLYLEVDDTFAVLRGLLFFLPWKESFYDTTKLNRYIESTFDEGFVRRMMTEADRHRLLLVASTNLDLGVMKIWHLAEEARRRGETNASERIQTILRASCAIPAVFSPVLIDECLHVDGGTTGQLFLGADPILLAEMIDQLADATPQVPFPKVRIWVIVNGKLRVPPGTTGHGWVAVAGRSLATLLHASTLSTLRRLEALQFIMNEKIPDRFEVRIVAVPDDVAEPKGGQMFDKEFMKLLSHRGQQMGRDTGSWLREVPVPEWSVAPPVPELVPPVSVPTEPITPGGD